MNNIQKNVYFLVQEQRLKRTLDMNAKFLSIGLQESQIPYNYPPHRQEEFEFIYILEGEVKYYCENKEFIVRAGDVYFISPGQIHEEHSIVEPLSFYYLKFNLTDFKGEKVTRLTDYIDKQLFPNIGETVKNLFEKCYKESSNKYLGYQQIVEQTIIELLINLERFLGPEFTKHNIQKSIDSLVFAVRDEISNNVGKNYSLDELADMFSTNKFYLIRSFKKNTGESIVEYMTKMKMNEAQRQLANTNNSIKSISYILGYQNQFYFSKVFKNYFKMTPKEFREKLITNILSEQSKPIEQFLNPILIHKDKLKYVEYPTEIKDLLFTYRRSVKSNIQVNEVIFNLSDNQSVEHFTLPFTYHDKDFILASVMTDHTRTLQLFKKQNGFVFDFYKNLNIEHITHPFISFINDKFILQAIKKENDSKTVIMVSDDLEDFKLLVELPSHIKNVRMIEHNNEIHTFFTLAGGKYGSGKIGYYKYASLEQLKNSSFREISSFSNLFISGEFGGINDIHYLHNGVLGMLCYITYKDENNILHSYPATFAFNMENKKSTKLKILLEKSAVLNTGKKTLDDHIYTAGIIRRANNRATLHIVIDKKAYAIMLDDPFVEYEFGIYKA